jgi:hypothetical protein
LGCEFTADAVLKQLRAGCLPNDKEAAILDRRLQIDALRNRVVSGDIPILIEILEHGCDPTAGFATSLLRHHRRDSRVRNGLEERWSTANAYLKNRIMWRLLDCEDLDPGWQMEFRRFVCAEWETFQEFNRTFYGASDIALKGLGSRLADPSFPGSKKWIYLCCAPGVLDDRDAVRAIIRLGSLLPDTAAQEVARLLIDRPPSSMPGSETHDLAVKALTADDLAFLAKAALSRMRDGVLPTDEESDWLNQLPMIDAVRLQVMQEDLPWIFAVVEGETGKRAGLCLSMLRKFATWEDVQVRLRARWEQSNAFLRSHLIWRILDDPEVPEEWHRRLFEFILAEWQTFQEVSLKFMGTPQNVVAQVLKRIGDASFPDAKKWAYFCRVPEVAEDQEAARALVTLGLQMKNAFTRHVAAELLRRFFPRPDFDPAKPAAGQAA